MRFYFDRGHDDVTGTDPGAVNGTLREGTMNIVTAKTAGERLIAHGHIIKFEPGNLSINVSAKVANAFKADFIISQHYNAGGGDRGEVIHSWKPGADILAQAVALGLHNAGQTEVNVIRSKPNRAGKAEYFGILRMAKMPGVIIEPCFIDNAADRTLADTEAKQMHIGTCIADAIAKIYGSNLYNHYNACIDQLVKDKVLISDDYWKNALANNIPVKGDYMATVIKRMTNLNDTTAAVNRLVEVGAICSPAYWVLNCAPGKICNPAYVKTLLINGVKRLGL